LTMILHVDYRN